MHYLSTRDKNIRITSAEAIAMGLSREGGLFVPERLPQISGAAIKSMCDMSYQQRAVYIMGMFLEDFTVRELNEYTSRAYSPKGFDTPEVAPVYSLDKDTHFLELWHGPTSAFKDMALQMLPYFLTASLDKTGEKREACILVATSGDTGKAALEGFRDVARTKIMVFYPRDGVSDVQKLQMTSQEGDNVGVCAVNGNFDDAQTGVKSIFSDENLRDELSDRGYFLSSANSINWGRLLPQIVYYISAYCDLINKKALLPGDKVNFCVPTGNFGNILAGYYAKSMGLPIGRLICASNKNDVLTEFINTGVYNKNREFYTTLSPSMDILISSNLERLLFDISGGSDNMVSGYMTELRDTGKYEISQRLKDTLSATFSAGCCSDAETKAAIGALFKDRGYLMDTHTAVAYKVLGDYRAETGDNAPCVVVSTASPYKFCDSVLEALGDNSGAEGVALIKRLEEVSGVAAPAPLKNLMHKKARFDGSVEKSDMTGVVRDFLK